MSSSLRLRVSGKKIPGNSKSADETRLVDGSKEKIILSDSGSQATPLHWIIYAVYIILIYLGAMKLDVRLPSPLSSDSAGDSRFSEERARRHMETLSGFGPRPSNSHSAEVLARNYLLAEIGNIRLAAKNRFRFDVDIQKPSGCFMLSSDFFNCYKNVTNIVVRLGRQSEQPSAHSLLINGHFDSVPAGPGATDDAVSCAIMLELIHTFVHRNPEELPYDLIFLFNGAEENYLQASHGFITQHPWRHSIRAFINLEACGAGGREMLFQVGPGNSWLSHAYLNNAPYPHCNIVGQELFENDFIPSDTDFRNFRDFGHKSGMDFAYISNGYVYHTEFDDGSFVRPGSMQRGGENIFATISALLYSPCFTKPCPEQDTKLVFFDVLGLFVIFYPLSFGTIMNYAASILIIVRILRHFQRSTQGDTDSYSISTFLFALIAHILATVFMIAMAWIVIQFVLFADLVMCWYSRPIMVVPLYLAPTLVVGFTVHAFLSWRYFRSSNARLRDRLRLEEASFHAALLLLSSILVALTWYGVASAYYVLLHVLLPLAKDLLNWIYRKVAGEGRYSATAAFVCHAIAMLPLIAIGSYGVLSVLEFFIPIMGRGGTVGNSEILIAAVCVACSIVFTLYMGGLVHLTVSFTEILKFVTFVSLLLIAVGAWTNFGAPYRYDPDAPRLRRLRLQHVSRKVYGIDGQLNSTENALFVTGMDFRGVKDLPAAAFLEGAQTPPCLSEDAFCGLPYFDALDERRPPAKNLWINVPSKPRFQTPVSIDLMEKVVADDMIKFNFSVTSHDFASLFLTPLNNWSVYEWSLTNDPIWPERTYFVRLCYVGRVEETGPWRFSVTLQPPDPASLKSAEPKLLLAVASHYVHGPYQYSDVTQNLINSIRERRQKPPTASFGYWKWMMTPDAFNSEYVAKYIK